MGPFLFPDQVTNPFLARERKGDSPQALAQLFWWSGMGAACSKERLEKLRELEPFQRGSGLGRKMDQMQRFLKME